MSGGRLFSIIGASISIFAAVLPVAASANTTSVEAENMTWSAGSGDFYGPAYTRKDTSNTSVGGYYLWNNTAGTGSVTTTQPLVEISLRLRSEQTNKGD